MNVNWNGLGFFGIFFVFGILGLLFKFFAVPICVTFLVLGFLGLILFGMPIWKKAWSSIIKAAQVCNDQMNGKW